MFIVPPYPTHPLSYWLTVDKPVKAGRQTIYQVTDISFVRKMGMEKAHLQDVVVFREWKPMHLVC